MENTTVTKKENMISVKELFNRSFAVYKTVFWPAMKMLLVSFLAVIPLVLTIGIYATIYVITPDNNIFMLLNIVLGLLGLAAIIFFIVVMYIAQIAIMIIVQKNDPNLKLKDAFMMAKAKALDFLGTSLLAGLLVLLWMLLLVVPGIIMAIHYTFISWVVLKENLFGMAAIKRSKSLVKNYWWAVAGRTILPTIIIMVIFGILSSFMVSEDGSGQKSYDFISQVFSWVATPFFVAYSYNMYKSLVKIKDNKQV